MLNGNRCNVILDQIVPVMNMFPITPTMKITIIKNTCMMVPEMLGPEKSFSSTELVTGTNEPLTHMKVMEMCLVSPWTWSIQPKDVNANTALDLVHSMFWSVKVVSSWSKLHLEEEKVDISCPLWTDTVDRSF